MDKIALLLLALALPAQTANPVPVTPASIATGNTLYGRYCASCHGKIGQGDGPAGAKLDPKPANLADADWKHGPADGDIFTVIHDGVNSTGMKGFASRMTAHEMWDLVNYLRSIGPHQ